MDIHHSFVEMPTGSRKQVQPLRALRAFRRLVADKEDTSQAFEVLTALAGGSLETAYNALLATPEGRRQASLRQELAERLEDSAWLQRLPPESVGAAYRAFIAPRKLSASGLADESRRLHDADFYAPGPLAWYARRLRDVHDIWHVLAGYETDALGEACVLAFSSPHVRSPGLAFIAIGATLEFERRAKTGAYARAVWQAWRNGRKALWLAPLDYVSLLAEPLELARRRLQIVQPTHYTAVPRQARDVIMIGRMATKAS